LTIKRTLAFNVQKANGTVTYKKTSGPKKITVTKAGKIKIKKGLKKRTYKVKVNLKAAGDKNHYSETKNVTVKVRVR
jgi:hypothetical protein